MQKHDVKIVVSYKKSKAWETEILLICNVMYYLLLLLSLTNNNLLSVVGGFNRREKGRVQRQDQ